jgi:hypothetical protein
MSSCYPPLSMTFCLKKEHPSRSKIITHDGPNDGNPLVSYPPDPNESFYNRKKDLPKGMFAELQKKGIRITYYKESR